MTEITSPDTCLWSFLMDMDQLKYTHHSWLNDLHDCEHAYWQDVVSVFPVEFDCHLLPQIYMSQCCWMEQELVAAKFLLNYCVIDHTVTALCWYFHVKTTCRRLSDSLQYNCSSIVSQRLKVDCLLLKGSHDEEELFILLPQEIHHINKLRLVSSVIYSQHNDDLGWEMFVRNNAPALL